MHDLFIGRSGGAASLLLHVEWRDACDLCDHGFGSACRDEHSCRRSSRRRDTYSARRSNRRDIPSVDRICCSCMGLWKADAFPKSVVGVIMGNEKTESSEQPVPWWRRPG